jgi:hypothetical protein
MILKTKRKDRLKWVTILMQMKYLKWPSRLKEMVPDNFGKSKIDAIIKEEMTHIKLFSKELVALT